MRTRILGKLLNSEVQEYLQRNDIIVVPVGTTEMHGGFPLNCETVLSEGVALRMAERCDGLVLTNLPYFYSGATATGRGTVQMSIRQGIDCLGAIARDLLRCGFRRQIYLSCHGPAHMTICPMIRDFYDETGVPILYVDMMQHMGRCTDLIQDFKMDFHAMIAGAYKIMGCLEDLPLVTGYDREVPSSCGEFQKLFRLGYQSAAVGYCFGENSDHLPTPDIPDPEAREALAQRGEKLIDGLTDRLDMPEVVSLLRRLEAYGLENEKKYPWMPAAWNRRE